MLISLTKKAADKLKIHHPFEPIKEDITFYNWYADLFNLQRKNYLLFTNAESLFSFFVYAGTQKEHRQVTQLFEEKLRNMIAREISLDPAYIEKVLRENDHYRFVKTNSRSVLGSMNDFKYQIEVHLRHGDTMTEKQDFIHHSMNRCPMQAIGMEYPREKMKELIDKRLGVV